jgi:dihydroorotase
MLYQNGVRVFYEEGNAPLSLLYQGMMQIAALGGLLILRCNLPTACPMGNPKSKETAIAAEAAPLAAAIIMAEATHCRLHITTVSTAHAIDQIRSAKARGVQITCDTAPQYFTYTDQELLFRGGSVKVDPPLRSKLDKQAVIEGLADGTIDCIVSDHTPVGAKNKSDNIDHSVPGMLGLQTAFSLAVQELGSIKNDNTPTLELHQIVKLFTTAPAKILGLPETVEVGAPAKLIILDPRKNYVLTEAMLKSKSKNCPWIGQELSYKVKFNYAEKQKKLPKEPKSEECE